LVITCADQFDQLIAFIGFEMNFAFRHRGSISQSRKIFKLQH
jgi:hypothetical protein